ncbi:MAG: tRNA (adenosine(37)-N6)-threonylcarbamoyltransferase complex ATPase subunit type 1 TsaE [Granulosicoccus sp.]
MIGQHNCTNRVIVQCLNEQAMIKLGGQIAHGIRGKALIALNGDLGAGKSVLVRSIIHALGYPGRVKSPTYTLIESYTLDESRRGISRIAHLDLYRLADPDELEYLGFDDVLYDHELVLIEWPEKAQDRLPAEQIRIDIAYAESEARLVNIYSEYPLLIPQESS